MVMDYMKKRVQNNDTEEPKEEHPDWASERNASLKAWQYVEGQKKEKARYIKRHHKITDYQIQKPYQIKGSEVAKALNMNRSSLMNTSAYSEDFKTYLDDVNTELEASKNAKLKKSRKSPSRGSIRNSKSELVQSNDELKKRVTELESQKTEELVRYAFDQLPLPVKKKLGID